MLDFERRDWRAVRRSVPPLTIEIESQSLPTVDWSEGGFLVRGCAAAVAPGATIRGKATLNAISGGFGARVVRVDSGTQTVAAQFADVDAPLLEEMRRIGRTVRS
jgi:hypothetical protein